MLALLLRHLGGQARRKGTAMKLKFTKTPTITKAVVAAVVFTIVWTASNVNLPSCSDPAAYLSNGGCVERQSYFHIVSGWLALASLITGVVLFILKQRKGSSRHEQAAPRPAPPEAPRPAETTVSEVWTHSDGAGQVTPADLNGSPGPERTANFCSECGMRAVAGDTFCQQCGAPVKNGTGSYPPDSVASY
jgi:hypothetical protein